MLVLSGGLSIKMWWSSSRGFLGALLALLPLHLFIFHSTFFIFISTSKPILAVSYSNYANQYTSHSSSLNLSAGLNLSISNSYDFSTVSGDYPYADPKHSESLLFKLGVPTVDEGGLFLPILSSPLFNRSHESPNSGFSLGFYISPLASPKDGPDFYPSTPCFSKDCHIYMAVCVGSSAYFNSSLTGYNLHEDPDVGQVSLGGATGANSSSPGIAPYVSVDGFVAPVWIANMGRPIKDANNASLVALEVPDSKGGRHMELQLRDGDQVVWKVSDVGMMEIQDTGKLLIYSSPSRRKVVWPQSPPTTDTLIHGQNLTEGMELSSNDSSYIARVEKGGLVLYLNKSCFSMEPQPPPYWIFPIPRRENQSHNTTANIRDLVYSAPCSKSSAYIFLNVTDEDTLRVSGSRSCGVSTALEFFTWNEVATVSWGFLRLENDGRLYVYAVANPINSPASATRHAVDTVTYTIGYSETYEGFYYNEQWRECDVPMACGPSGICTPGANTICSCQESFEPVDSTDISQGCKPRTTLPNCSIGIEHVHTTGFVQLNSTASIFLFNLWSFNFTGGSVDACKNWCSSNCSCKGFIYQSNTSACLFIAHDDISLLHVADTNLTFFNYANFSWDDPYVQQVVLASNYVTYLKVVAVHGASDRVVLRTILLAIIPSIVAGVMLGLAGYFLTAWRKKQAQMILQAQEDQELQDILPLLPSRFSYKDLHEATKGFSKLLGEGGCGSVYAGVLYDGRKVAVKVLKFVLQSQEQSKQFLAEVASVGRTNHHNIVRLVGFCWEVSQRVLVYEYVERGALDHWLFVGGSRVMDSPLLDWHTRYNVALGMVRGLHYLHEQCEQPILHFDIKPQNILLDDAFVAKLADFGMSRIMQRDMSSVMTGVRGTPGYIAPEWFTHGSVSKKSDVYSMGMVMLELVAGRMILDKSLLLNDSIDSLDKEAWHLPSWAAQKCEEGLIMQELVDKRLHVSGLQCEQVERLLYIAFWCIHEDPRLRPSVPTILTWLEGTSHIDVPLSSFAFHARKHATDRHASFSSKTNPRCFT